MEPEVTSKGTGSDWKCGGQVILFGKPLTRGEKEHRGLTDQGRDHLTDSSSRNRFVYI